MRPYYDHAGITIYHGRAEDVLPTLDKESIDLVLTDPPYGIAHPTDYRARGRGKLAACRDYAPVFDDDKPFDPNWILALGVPTVLWGANHYADKLPASSGWLVWDKERPDDLDQATCEIAWTNFVKGIRRYRFMWNGMLRASDEPLIHPTQKPVALMKWVLSLKWTPQQGTIVDPYMGSGTTLVAAQSLGRRAIGIEIEEKYCRLAVDRLRQMPLPLIEPIGQEKLRLSTQGGLFDGSLSNGRDQTENIRGQQGSHAVSGGAAETGRDPKAIIPGGSNINSVEGIKGDSDMEPEGRGINVMEGRKAN